MPAKFLEPQKPKNSLRNTRAGRGLADEVQVAVDGMQDRNRCFEDLLSGLVQNLRDRDEHAIFHYPVDTNLLWDYLDRVSEPMDFQTMSANIESGSYKTFSAFQLDMGLIWENCRKYNGVDSVSLLWVANHSKSIPYPISHT